MEKIVRFKRNWEEGFIRICIVEGDKVEIDVPLYLFQKRFMELVELPNLMLKTKGRAKELVSQAVQDAFDTAINELKDETVRV